MTWSDADLTQTHDCLSLMIFGVKRGNERKNSKLFDHHSVFYTKYMK